MKRIKELKDNGFVKVKEVQGLYINKEAIVFDLTKNEVLKQNAKNNIIVNGKTYNVPKLILSVFKGEKIRSGRIVYIDGNKSNLSPDNIKYRLLFDQKNRKEVDRDNLLKAIRCYIAVGKRYTVKDLFITRLFLQTITEKRGFFILKKDMEYITIYKEYINSSLPFKSIATVATENRLKCRDCNMIINGFTTLLITEILTDLQNGILHIQEYKPKEPTNTEILKRLNETRILQGLNTIPLRKESLKQKLKGLEKKRIDFNKKTDEILNQNIKELT